MSIPFSCRRNVIRTSNYVQLSMLVSYFFMFYYILTYLWSNFVYDFYCGFVKTFPERN